MWLLRELKPSFKTIADFRKDNPKSIIGVFTEFNMICAKAELIGAEKMALDGTKARAVNSKERYLTESSLKHKIDYFTQEAENYLTHLDENDKREDEQVDLEKKYLHAQKRIQELEEEKKRLKQSGSYGKTDPDCKMMKMNDGGFTPAYNVQTITDSKYHLVIQVDAVSTPADQTQLYDQSECLMAFLKKAKLLRTGNRKDQMPPILLADTGYYNGSDLLKCMELGLKPIVAAPKEQDPGPYGKASFQYIEETDVVLCPQGQELQRIESKTQIVYRSDEACNQCEVKSKCTSNQVRGRTLNYTMEPKDEIFINNLMKTLWDAESYRTRKETAEHPYGTIKRGYGYTHTNLKGCMKVTADFSMHFLSYNFKRVRNILGFDKMNVSPESNDYVNEFIA